MKLYHTKDGIVAEYQEKFYLLDSQNWDTFINQDELYATTVALISKLDPLDIPLDRKNFLPPVESQEVWGSGVTYYRSRVARMEESAESGGHVFYDRVYEAKRPEIFYKGNKRRAVGHGDAVTIRSDSTWNVPEPELTLFITANKKIVGYTIGNDMSSRDIEGENPLYLPQAKVWQGSTALGPCLFVPEDGKLPISGISLEIHRNGEVVFEGTTSTDQIKRKFEELADYLFFADEFPEGVFLMTGTGIIPGDDFSLEEGDEVRITIESIGTLANTVKVFSK